MKRRTRRIEPDAMKLLKNILAATQVVAPTLAVSLPRQAETTVFSPDFAVILPSVVGSAINVIDPLWAYVRGIRGARAFWLGADAPADGQDLVVVAMLNPAPFEPYHEYGETCRLCTYGDDSRPLLGLLFGAGCITADVDRQLPDTPGFLRVVWDLNAMNVRVLWYATQAEPQIVYSDFISGVLTDVADPLWVASAVTGSGPSLRRSRADTAHLAYLERFADLVIAGDLDLHQARQMAEYRS